MLLLSCLLPMRVLFSNCFLGFSPPVWSTKNMPPPFFLSLTRLDNKKISLIYHPFLPFLSRRLALVFIYRSFLENIYWVLIYI